MVNLFLLLSLGCIVTAVLVGGCSSASSAPDPVVRTVPPTEASALIEERGQQPGFVIVDVRRPDEFAAGHIPGAGNIASATFPEHIAGLDPDGVYVVYCQRGGRSAGVCTMMQEAGFGEIYEIEGGISAWKAAGLPVTGD